jgi:uncharacterized protein YoxC
VNTGINLVTFIGSVADAWRAAGGEASGIIGSAEKLSKRLADWGKSGQGQNTMITYFVQVRDFVDRVVNALKNMAPMLVTIGQFVREWSAAMLTVVGAAAQLSVWVQEHTGLLKPLLILYLSFRTIAPIWQMLSTAASNYTKVVKGLGSAGVPVFEGMNNGLRQVHSSMDVLRGKTESIIPVSKRHTGALSAQGEALKGVFANMKDLTKSTSPAMAGLNSVATATSNATTKVGGSVTAGLRGAVGGLAAFLGPMALAMVAAGGIVWAVNKLGEAHRNAARDADTQRAALDSLKQSLDSSTGAFTNASQMDTARSANKYTIPNFPGGGDRNIYQDFAKTGLGTPQQLVQATNPTQTQARGDLLSKIDKQVEAKVTSSEEWKRGHEFWESHGVSSNVMAMAMNGDQASVAKVQAAEKQAFDPKNTGNLGDRSYQAAKRAEHGISDLGAMISGTGSYELSSSGIFIRDRAGAAGAAGAQTQQDQQAAFGKWRVKPGSTLGRPGVRA